MHQFGILASHHIFSTNPNSEHPFSLSLGDPKLKLHLPMNASQAESHDNPWIPSKPHLLNYPYPLQMAFPTSSQTICATEDSFPLRFTSRKSIHRSLPRKNLPESPKHSDHSATSTLRGDKMATKLAKRSKHHSSPRCICTTPRRDRTMKSRVWSPLLRSKHHATNRAVTSHRGVHWLTVFPQGKASPSGIEYSQEKKNKVARFQVAFTFNLITLCLKDFPPVQQLRRQLTKKSPRGLIPFGNLTYLAGNECIFAKCMHQQIINLHCYVPLPEGLVLWLKCHNPYIEGCQGAR